MIDRFLQMLRRVLYGDQVEIVPGKFESFLEAPVRLEDVPERWRGHHD